MPEQKEYINEMLHRFQVGMENAKPSSTPMDPDVHLDNPVCEDRPADKTLYLSLVGCYVQLPRSNPIP
jgi:hypothetical protein